MKIITIIKNGKSTERNTQWIIVKKSDKYGVAMLAYFKNSLNGKYLHIKTKNPAQVTLFYHYISETYILQILKFRIAEENIVKNYYNFKKKYDILIKDKISHL